MTDTTLTSENDIPTSPIPAVFSDDATRPSTLPPSPPGFPWEQQDASAIGSKAPAPPKSAFSLLGKRKALDSISDNARPGKKVATAAKPERKSLAQMQISLGQETQTRCRTCGMEYVPSSAEDRKLHGKYHQQNTEGYDVGKDFASKASKHSLFVGARKDDRICAIDCFASYARKRRGQAVLEVVQRELGAVEITREEIWDVKRGNWTLSGEPTYRAYLYVRQSKCVGFLLVQTIKEAYRVIEPPSSVALSADGGKDDQRSTKGALAVLKARQQATTQLLQQPIELSKEASPAILGISRIWTSATHRHQRIATTLLDRAFKDYNQRSDRGNSARIGLQPKWERSGESKDTLERLDSMIPAMQRLESKDAVAFSQPTESGVKLARRWFGMAYGWGVYVD